MYTLYTHNNCRRSTDPSAIAWRSRYHYNTPNTYFFYTKIDIFLLQNTFFFIQRHPRSTRFVVFYSLAETNFDDVLTDCNARQPCSGDV